MQLTKVLTWISLFFSVSVAVLLIVLVIQGRSAQASRNQGLRTFICYFEQAALRSPHQTPEQRQTAIRFFRAVMAKLHEPPCSTP